jgi:hypothetical protein
MGNESAGGPRSVRRLYLQPLLHPTERSRLAIATVAALIAPALFALVLVRAHRTAELAVLGGFLILLLGSIWLGLQVRKAMLLGRSVKVTERSLPAVQSVLDEVRTRLDYHRPIDVYIADKLPGKPNMPVTVVSYFGTKMIVIEGGLIGDLLEPARRPQLTFLLARFIGAFKARHMRMDVIEVLISAVNWVRFVNVFLKPYYRATAYSGDQIGLACSDLRTSLAATSRLMTGKDVAPAVVARGVIDQAAVVSRRLVPRLGQLLSREPHLTSRYLNLLFFARVHAPAEWSAFLGEVDPATASELEALGARSPHTEALIAPRPLKEAFRPVRPWQDDAGTVGSALAAMVAGALLGLSTIVADGGLKDADAGVLVVNAALVAGLLVAAPATIWRRAPGWAAVTALIAAALAGWTQLVLVVDVKVAAPSVDAWSYPLTTWVAQASCVVALAAAACLSVTWRQQPITTDRRPSPRSRVFAAGAVVGGGLVVASSFLAWYGFDGKTVTLWEANAGVIDGLTVALGAALVCAGVAGVLTTWRGLPWLTALLGCVAFGFVFAPSDFGESVSLEAGWWLGLGGAGVALACAVLGWLTAGAPPVAGSGARVRTSRWSGAVPVPAPF